MLKKPKISPSERDEIASLIACGESLRKIALDLGRSVSSISQEVKRNSVGGEYHSIAAQELSKRRNIQSRRNNPLKSSQIFSYVVDKLRCGWSPEQISGRLKRDNKGKSVICFETIYRYIYSEEGKKKNLCEYLVRHHYKRRKWHSRYLYQRGIANKVNIKLRPKEVENRKIFGHWEADTVEGRAHQKGIQTLLERKTRYYLAKILTVIDSEYGVRAQRDLLQGFPGKARKTLTLDNGKENYNHNKLQEWLGIKTYFCDPYCAWQRGANEYHNGVLRRYIPKKADITNLSQEDLNSIVWEINQRPRKCLNYQTPQELFTKEIRTLKIQKCSDST